MKFVEFPKIARLNREVIVTEKIDGTNASVTWQPIVDSDDLAYGDVEGQSLGIFAPRDGDTPMRLWAGSRTRWIQPDNDNFGFAAWVLENAAELYRLGEGSHFGEWWGAGIQRRYGLTEKRWSLFNTYRWSDDDARPACCSVVPVIVRGAAQDGFAVAAKALEELRAHGSFAAPGFMKPEGIVAFHTASNEMFKATLEKDEEWKGKSRAA